MNMHDDYTEDDVRAEAEELAADPNRGLSKHHLRVWLVGADDPVDVWTANPDLIGWDQTRARKGWPAPDVAPNLWMTFVGWRALRRNNLTALGWEEFSGEHCLDIKMVHDAPVDPTRPTPDVGSS